MAQNRVCGADAARWQGGPAPARGLLRSSEFRSRGQQGAMQPGRHPLARLCGSQGSQQTGQ